MKEAETKEMEELEKVKSNLLYLNRLHVVPGWRWTDSLWKKFKDFFSGVKMCRDEFGNVVLNASDVTEVYERISSGKTIFFQTHLDHPGAIVIGKRYIQEGQFLYSALWGGRYAPSLEGKTVGVYLPGHVSGIKVMVEKDISKHGERIIYFYADENVVIGASIHFPLNSSGIIEVQNEITNFALDDTVNCAVLLNIFRQLIGDNVFAVLTLDEERGGSGAIYFADNILKHCSNGMPCFINLEAPAENLNADFTIGTGIRIRTADSRCNFTDVVTQPLIRLLCDAKKMPILTGGTETSIFIEKGFCAGSLAIPLRHAHNGAVDGMWCDEKANTFDIHQMHASVNKIISNVKQLLKSVPGNVLPKRETSVRIIDEASKTIENIRRSRGYSDFLVNVARDRSATLSEYGVRLASLGAEGYDKIKNVLMNSDLPNIDVAVLRQKAVNALERLKSEITTKQSSILEITLLFNANFNAKRIKKGIALSVDKLDHDALDRILYHEIVHWLTKDILKAYYYQPVVRSIVGEGLACYLSGKILDIPAVKAINVKPSAYVEFQNKERYLKDLIIKIISGMYVEITGDKHKILRENGMYDPFIISPDNPYSKYGYYVGYNFFEFCEKSGGSAVALINNVDLVRRKLDAYLTS